MRRLSPATTSITILAFLLVVPQSFAEIISGDSVEWATVDSDLVVRGHITDVRQTGGEGKIVWEQAEFRVAETLKGKAGKQVEFAIRGPMPRLDTWQREQAELLLFLVAGKRRVKEDKKYADVEWALRSTSFPEPAVIRLDDKLQDALWDKQIISMNLTILKERTKFFKTIRASLPTKKTAKASIASYRMEVPWGTEAHQVLYGGSAAYLTIPINDHLHRLAWEWIKSEDYLLRLEGVRTLGHFQSEDSIDRLSPLLKDAGYTIRRGDNNERVRHYEVRQAAYEILKKWNVQVVKPVLRESIAKGEGAMNEAAAKPAFLPSIKSTGFQGHREVTPLEKAPLLVAIQEAMAKSYSNLQGRRLSDEVVGSGWANYEYRGKGGAIDLAIYRAASAAEAAKKMRQIDLQVADRSHFEILRDFGEEACRYGSDGMLLVRRSNLLIKITTANGPDPRDVAKRILKCTEESKNETAIREATAAPADSGNQGNPVRKVTTAEQPDKVARGSLSLIPALYHTETKGPFRLSREVSGFAEQRESIWEVKFYMGLMGKELFQSVWVSSSGQTRTMLPTELGRARLNSRYPIDVFFKVSI